ncbi:MAG TPA: hypothetical protein PJ991_07115 [Kiritimatiellia bacterium]|nr:hypothetical protein [Kiritimatiellia bacterium]
MNDSTNLSSSGADDSRCLRVTTVLRTLATAVLFASFSAHDTRAQTNQFAGLWVGVATLNAVSGANPTASDLGFDLGIQSQLTRQTLVGWNDTWRYNDTGANLGIGWRNIFNDSGWNTGPAPLGYGYGDESTTLNFGNATNKHPTTYFRRTFTVADPQAYASLRFRVFRDDGVVVYLNGSLVMRDNLSAVYTHNTYALSAIEGTNQANYVELVVPATLLLQTNILSAEVHIASPGDADKRFALELTGIISAPSPSTLLPIRSIWRYEDNGIDLGTAWKEPGFDDSGWNSGPGKLGYGDGDEATIIGFGNATNKNRTTYFRADFNVANPNAISELNFLLRRDDGAVIYINGQEVLRSNMPESGDINYFSEPIIAIGAADESQYLQYTVGSVGLVTGLNVVAVSVHQHPSELGIGSIGVPTPTRATMPLRVLLHVDHSGQVRLLKDVIQMWKDGILSPAGDGTNVVSTTPGRYVLLTDETLVSQYKGVANRDGELVGRRVSAIGFDFEDQSLLMSGAFGAGNRVSVTNNIPPNFRTNPFRHKFHPDHDNLTPDYSGYQQEALDISRIISLDFSLRYPPELELPTATPPPSWGRDRIGGIYFEELRGLHKESIQVQGSFELERISLIDRLNDQ